MTKFLIIPLDATYDYCFLGLSQILADAYCHHAVHPSATSSTKTCFTLPECTLNFTYRLIMTKP